MRVISNNGYYLAITLYICTVAGINGQATFIRSVCCIQSYIIIVKILYQIDHINIGVEPPIVICEVQKVICHEDPM